MSSPFPGMDPFLEDPDIFPNLHDQLIVYLSEHVQPKLPEPYYAKVRQRTWVEFVEGPRYPDVSVMISARNGGSHETESGGVAVAPAQAARPITVSVSDLPSDEFRETFLEIYSKLDGDKRLVTSLEVLSPTYKSPGDEASGAYKQKQREVLASQVNLVEIDLLRGGTHVTAVPKSRLVERCGAFDYHVSVHRFDQAGEFDIYPIQLTEALPTISIPLLPHDGVVEADLQSVFLRSYETGPYRREVDYSKVPPPPALSPERLAWARSVVAARQQRA